MNLSSSLQYFGVSNLLWLDYTGLQSKPINLCPLPSNLLQLQQVQKQKSAKINHLQRLDSNVNQRTWQSIQSFGVNKSQISLTHKNSVSPSPFESIWVFGNMGLGLTIKVDTFQNRTLPLISSDKDIRDLSPEFCSETSRQTEIVACNWASIGAGNSKLLYNVF